VLGRIRLGACLAFEDDSAKPEPPIWTSLNDWKDADPDNMPREQWMKLLRPLLLP
jgi:hypothetical protein